jgi:hypothetical protein
MSIRRPLDLVEVQSPCPRDWNQMSGSAQSRFCEHCQKHVHDLSAMTLSEAEALICREAGELCVRFTRLPNGKVKTLDYCAPSGRKGFGWRFWTAVVAIAAAIAACVLGHTSARVGAGTTVVGTMPLTTPPAATTSNGSPPPPCQTP